MKRLAALFFLSIVFTGTVQAQFLKKLKQRATNAIERTVTNRAEREVEKSTDRALDSIIEAPKGDNENKEASSKKEGVFNPLSMMGGPVNYENNYNFPLSVTMDVQEGNKASKTQTMLQFYGKDKYGLKEPDSGQITVMDFKNQSALMLNPKDKTGQAVSLIFLDKMMQQVDLNVEDTNTNEVSFNKTGKSKTIAGYLSYEYEIISEDSKAFIWFAPEVPFSFKDYMQGFTKLFGKHFQGKWDDSFWDAYGFMMEGENYNKKGKLESRMTVTKINTEEFILNTADYNIQKL